MCRSSPGRRLVVSTVLSLGEIVIFAVKNTVHGNSLIFLGQWFGSPVRVRWWYISFIKLSYGWSRWRWISSHGMGYFLNKLMIIGPMVKVIMSFYGDFCLSTLMISIVMKSSSLWCLCLVSVSTLIFFPISVVIFNHLSASVMTLLDWW